MIGASTIFIIVFLAFLITERLLFTSRMFDNNVPWGSLESKFGFFKLVVKLVQTTSFVFDKEGKARAYVNLICFFLCIGIIFNRVTKGVIIDDYVFYTTLVYETELTWLFFASAVIVIFEL